MTTPLDIITKALKDAGVLGVGQTALAEDVNDAFLTLNWMILQWAKKRWLVYRLQTLSVMSTGAQWYTIGPGADIHIMSRPSKIESAFVRFNPQPSPPPVAPQPQPIQLGPSPYVWIAPEDGVIDITGGTGVSLQYSSVNGNSQWVPATSPIAVFKNDAVLITYTDAPDAEFTPTRVTPVDGPVPTTAVDYYLEILYAREDYDRITMKSLQSVPYLLFYDSDYPVGKVYPFPNPQASLYELFVTVKETLHQFTSLAQEIVLPPEYMAALNYNLALRLRSQYQLPPPPHDQLPNLAADSLATIRESNVQIPLLVMPRNLLWRRPYNIYSDNTVR